MKAGVSSADDAQIRDGTFTCNLKKNRTWSASQTSLEQETEHMSSYLQFFATIHGGNQRNPPVTVQAERAPSATSTVNVCNYTTC